MIIIILIIIIIIKPLSRHGWPVFPGWCDCCLLLLHNDVLVHHLILFPECMEDYVSSHPEHPCAVAPARDPLKHPEQNARGMEKPLKWRKDRLPRLTLYPVCCCLCPGTGNIISTEHGMQSFLNFQQAIKSWLSSMQDASSKYQKK